MTTAVFPDQGIIFWPVGTGDSTTIVFDEECVLQVDLHHMAAADAEGAVCCPVVDRLLESLPRRDGKPYLAVFALTHADLDHCKGFGDLLDSDVLVGEIWATPRLWREYADEAEMCEDARRFHEEADRRVQASLEHLAAWRDVPSGDRVRIIGYDTDVNDPSHPYSVLPDEQRSFPGDVVTVVDGVDVGHRFEAFIHAPFKDDCAAARNDTSLAMQVTLRNGETDGRVLLFGDLAYPTLRLIFDRSVEAGNADRLQWDVLLAPHHCSRKVMYAPDENGEEEMKQDILDDFDASRQEPAYVVASSNPVPATNQPRDNPPHAKAKARYQELGIEQFLCTQEHGSVDAPQPAVFALVPGVGLVLQPIEAVESESLGKTMAKLAAAAAGGTGTLIATQEALKRARGTDAAPVKPVGFGGS
ncbi:MAG: hypothetical protein AB7R89_03265 [Dehalococcoidia bacterium]